MRYIVLKENIDILEIKSRQEYLMDTFNLYTIPFTTNNYLELRSIPSNVLDVIFIYGHNNRVYDFLKNKAPYEKYIVLITCYIGDIKNIKLKNKKVYISNKDLTTKFDGKEYGFYHEITEAELNLYNSNLESLEERIKSNFERL